MKPAVRRGDHFLISILWTWGAVATNLFIGLILSPIIIRRLGEERYGIWALGFALLEYLFVFDFGFRSGVVNLIARLHTTQDPPAMNAVINTALAYLGTMGTVIILLTAFGHRLAAGLFNVSPQYLDEFSHLLIVIGIGFAANLAMATFQASLEGMQQFRLLNRNYVLSLLARAAGSLWILSSEGGLVALGALTVGCQLGGNLLNIWSLYQAFPALRLGPRWFSRAYLDQLARFGVRTLGAALAQTILTQGPAILVARALPEAFVGFYTLPSRLLQYSVDAIGRIGFITTPNAAGQMERGDRAGIAALGIFLNRYCLALFLPFAIYVLVWGEALIGRWAGPRFAEYSVPLLPAFVVSTMLATAAQFNSSSILFGIAQHGAYAKVLMVEAVLLLVLFPWSLMRSGIAGAALAAGTLMFLCRGLGTPWLLCRVLPFSFPQYMAGIYLRPALTLIPLALAAWFLRRSVFTGDTWWQLLAALAAMGLLQVLLFAAFVLEPAHRKTILARFRRPA